MKKQIKYRAFLSIISVSILLFVIYKIKFLGIGEFGLTLSQSEVFLRFLALTFLGFTISTLIFKITNKSDLSKLELILFSFFGSLLLTIIKVDLYQIIFFQVSYILIALFSKNKFIWFILALSLYLITASVISISLPNHWCFLINIATTILVILLFGLQSEHSLTTLTSIVAIILFNSYLYLKYDNVTTQYITSTLVLTIILGLKTLTRAYWSKIILIIPLGVLIHSTIHAIIIAKMGLEISPYNIKFLSSLGFYTLISALLVLSNQLIIKKISPV